MRALPAFAMICAALIALAPTAEARKSNPFSGLEGSWRGSGTASFDGGRKERLSCSARYRPAGGRSLSMSIRCANPSLNVQLNGRLVYRNGRVSGSWSESSTGMGGKTVGRAGSSSLRLRFGGDLSGRVSVSYSKSRQSVSITTSSPVFRKANVRLRRR